MEFMGAQMWVQNVERSKLEQWWLPDDIKMANHEVVTHYINYINYMFLVYM